MHDRARVGYTTSILMQIWERESLLAARLKLCPGGKWFHPSFKQVLRVIVALLDPHPGGKDCRQDVGFVRVAQLPLHGLKEDVLFRYFIRHGSQVSWQRGVDCISIGLVVLVEIANMFG